eukprot:scaffold2308_cov215-Skeletonema_menzelii.AAC.3
MNTKKLRAYEGRPPSPLRTGCIYLQCTTTRFNNFHPSPDRKSRFALHFAFFHQFRVLVRIFDLFWRIGTSSRHSSLENHY